MFGSVGAEVAESEAGGEGDVAAVEGKGAADGVTSGLGDDAVLLGCATHPVSNSTTRPKTKTDRSRQATVHLRIVQTLQYRQSPSAQRRDATQGRRRFRMLTQ
jgi:hypothetical protein